MQTEPLANEIEHDDSVKEAVTATIGEILLQERQRRGLSEKQVADKLHITMHNVKALEMGNYEKLPGAVFAKGYLKNYALLLNLDADELLLRYEELRLQQAKVVEENPQNTRQKKDRNRSWLILSVIVFIVGFSALWSYNNFLVVTPEEEAPPQQLAPPQQADSPLPSSISARLSDSRQFPRPAAVATANQATGSDSLALQVAENEDISPESTGSTGLEKLPVANAVAEQQLIQISAGGNDVLRIVFSRESWVEVNDSASNNIYRDLRQADDILEIVGRAPFNILLGDASVTSMTLNGDNIELSSYIRIDNSARLTVGL